jgi:hypothetical protein
MIREASRSEAERDTRENRRRLPFEGRNKKNKRREKRTASSILRTPKSRKGKQCFYLARGS